MHTKDVIMKSEIIDISMQLQTFGNKEIHRCKKSVRFQIEEGSDSREMNKYSYDSRLFIAERTGKFKVF